MTLPAAITPRGDGHELAAHDVGDEQLVRAVVLLRVGVVPDEAVPVLVVRLVVGLDPGADPALGGIAVPLAVAVGER
jgi:hypothetical protein